MFSLEKTTEQMIYEKTCIDEFEKFIKNTRTEPVKKEYAEAYPTFPMNRLVYSLTYNDMIKDLSKKYNSAVLGEVLGYKNIRISEYIDLVKLGEHNFTFKEAMNIIRSVREDIGPEVFYGAVIANNEHVDVNPLHPLVLHEFMKFSDEELEAQGLTNYTVIIYTFNDKISTLRADYPKHFEVKPEYMSDVINLIAGTDFKQETFTVIEDVNLEQNNNRFEIAYKEVLIDLAGKEIEVNKGDEHLNGHVVPGQILNLKGMTYPYYGAIYIKNGSAWNISPMWATNIDSPNELTDWEYGSSICTKVGDPSTADGCKTLNHSNTTSQRNQYTFTEGAMGYAQVVVDVALSTMYADYNPTKHIIEIPKLTFNEFQIENQDATKKDYLEYLKTRLKGKK